MTDDYLNQQALQLLPDSSCIRKLCTTRAVSSGDVVFVSDPLASVLLAEEVTRRCHACLQEAVPNDTGNDKAEDSPNSLMHCGGCHYALYCDTACQRIAWPRHRLECRYRQQRHLAILLGNDPELLLLLRTCDLLKMNNSTTIPQLIHIKKLFLSLPDHRLKHTPWSLDRYGEVADKVLQVAPPHLTSWLTKSLLIEHQCRFGCNNFTMVDDRCHPIGVGVYPVASLLNHSCRPNCIYRFDGVQLQVIAQRPISAGEELTISYIDWIYGPNERTNQLERQYFFQCQCLRCIDGENNDPLDRLLRHSTNVFTNIDLDDWISEQMKSPNTLLQQTTRSIIGDLLLESTNLTNELFIERQKYWRMKLGDKDESTAIGNLFSRTILEYVGGYMNRELAKGNWNEAGEASRYRLSIYLLVYGRYHPLVPLEILTLSSCLWNSEQSGMVRDVHSFLQTMKDLMLKTHPNAQKNNTVLYKQYKELHDKVRRELSAIYY